MEELPVSTVVATAGFLAGAVFGGVVNKTNFCTMGALTDIVFMNNYSRLRSWLLAIAVAIIGSQTLHVMGVINLYQSIYQTPNLGWLSAIVGGLMFGFGMVMAGGCASKNLVRVGGGNLKSVVVVIVLGIFAYMTLRGLIGMARVQMERATMVDLSEIGLASQGIIDMIASIGGSDPEDLRVSISTVVVLGLLFFCFKDDEFRASGNNIFAGVVIGLLIPVGWWITGVLGYDDFEPTPLSSFTFVSPTGNSLQYMMTFTGATISFGIAIVGGVIFGSFLVAVSTKTFRIEAFSGNDDMIRQMSGAALMGTGGTLALGCTIGQGITGMSTLALGSLIALLSIILGGLIGLKYLEEGNLGGAVKALFSTS